MSAGVEVVVGTSEEADDDDCEEDEGFDEDGFGGGAMFEAAMFEAAVEVGYEQWDEVDGLATDYEEAGKSNAMDAVERWRCER
ncbi:hypothetical protein RHGRI_007805 [Rhododendron griersonianum]|uniref:Uncharacterized protein n=1 Tax=Rhododendron griersonianum TaxID=479676 RepID=A0AAV6KY37_9ERIC|nr:hypothetical protein RHGRI_007805 [Rhododendron griersonianum]